MVLHETLLSISEPAVPFRNDLYDQPNTVKTLNENSETFMFGDSPYSRHNFLLVFKIPLS